MDLRGDKIIWEEEQIEEFKEKNEMRQEVMSEVKKQNENKIFEGKNRN